MNYFIKQLEERVVASEIELVSWSERMDLVAISNAKGEIALHRLTWSRAWCLGPPKDGARVKAIAWKPDGNIIAIGYCSSKILLVSVENKSLVNKLEVKGDITCMAWIKQRSETKNIKVTTEQGEFHVNKVANSTIYLPDPPSLTNLGSFAPSEPDSSYINLHKQTELNMLIVGTMQGIVYISVFGCSPFITYNLNNFLGCNCSIISAYLSEDLNLLYVTVQDDTSMVKIIVVNTDIFKSHDKELFSVCMKHEYLNAITKYLDTTISALKETWENILLEMDEKLSKYASKVPKGTMSSDFLDLLVFGTVTDQMQTFLLHDLTKKGLEKFGQTIEMSYSNMQKMLLRNVTKVSQNITYHLSELRGMARFKNAYGWICLDETTITEALLMNGAFLSKSGEMQLIINTSMVNYKAFFRWLYTAIMHLTEETIPSDLPKLTQQDIEYITEFILNFDNINASNSEDGSKTGFVMERLGQYLIDAPLIIPSGMETNGWNSFLDQNECIRKLPNVINHCKETSLIQQFNLLNKSIEKCFECFRDSVAQQFKIKSVINILEFPQDSFKLTRITVDPKTEVYAFLAEPSHSQGLYCLELTTEEETVAKAGYIFVPQLMLQNQQTLGDNYEILDLQFYTLKLLSLLLQENTSGRTGVICQVSAAAIREKILEVRVDREVCTQDLIKINTCTLGNSILRNTEGMVASNFAVSGSRKVSLVVAENRRKVRIYEMEADEDEEDDAEMSNSLIRENDMSMIDEHK